MKIKELELRYFRSYRHFKCVFDDNLNIIIGPNGSGKTNILESLVFIANTHSFRTNDDEILIHKDADFAKIELSTEKQRLKAVISKNGKSLYLGDQNIKRSSDFIGNLSIVLFEPSELDLFNDSPRIRRRLLDLEIGKVSRKYLLDSITYTKLLKDKNALLKKESCDEVYLSLLNEKMVPLIIEIVKKRKEFTDLINRYLKDYYQKLTASSDVVRVEYKTEMSLSGDEVKEMLDKAIKRDLFLTYASKGVHKDDLIFYFNEEKIENFASQGQKRMVLIAFKLSLMRYIESVTKDKPVLLLDDILSELDLKNSERLLNLLDDDMQIIITTTDLKDISIRKKYRLFNIERKEGLWQTKNHIIQPKTYRSLKV